MISIIISSKDPQQLAKVTENIKATIGVPYEIVSIANANGEMGICQVYNLGAERSRFDTFCFMHEDACFLTQNWGEVVQRLLSDKSIGLVGVAGSTSLVDFPASWTGYVPHLRSKVIQYHKNKMLDSWEFNPRHEKCSDVAVVDGVWMCCRRETWRKHRFDSESFRGFHFYDGDFSLQILQEARVCVTFEVAVEHFSTGNYNQQWFEQAQIFYGKWKHKLPVLVTHRSRADLFHARRQALDELRERLRHSGYNRWTLMLLAIRYPMTLRQYLSSMVYRYKKRWF